ncbi:MAG: GIY-YIG nuclease family protein [Patescibacteria group bacterium]|jgi:predicted GIY-YIG superfamily endonuclease
MFFVYILKHRLDGTLYKGWTTDIERRLNEHQTGGTCTTAKKNGDYVLTWYCAFPTKTQAICFEKYLKSGSGRAFANKRLLV